MAKLIVVGGSLGGLLAGNVLLRRGHDVRILERSADSLDGRGAGIVTHRRLVEALAVAGVPAAETLGVAVTGRVALAADGSTAAAWDYAQVLTSWSRLYRLLLAAFPADRYLAGRDVVETSTHGAGVRARCADGATFEADLLVASDGIRSVVRRQWLPEASARYAGYVAWRGVCDEASLSRHTRSTLFPFFGFGLPDGEQMLGYPVAGPADSVEVGRRRYNFVWYRPADEGGRLRELLTDADGDHHPLGIAPNRIDWREVGRMRRDGTDRLAPQWAEILQKTAQPFLQPIHDLDSSRIAFGPIALMGDAAFVARPHPGMGVTKAAEDALALADAIDALGASPAALLAYETQRLPAGRAVVQRARRLGAYLEATAARAPVASRDPMTVVRETAIDLSREAIVA